MKIKASNVGKYNANLKAMQSLEATLSSEAMKAREDFAYFCEYVTRNAVTVIKLAEHHKEWVKLLVTGEDSKCLRGIAGVNTSILSPRGASKSTVLGLFVAWVIGYNTIHHNPVQILYLSYSKDAARGKSETIKTLIESSEYQQIFPLVRRGEKWTDSHWSIDYQQAGISSAGTEQFTLICAGAGGSITSKRASLIVYDDSIKSEEQIANVAVRNKIARNYQMVIRPTLLEGGRIISLGTRFRPDDIHTTHFIPEKGWLQIEQSAVITEDGKERSYWESMWSLKFLMETKLELGPSAFSFQYMNQIVPLEELGLKETWITFSEIPHTFESFAVGIDLASSLKTKADYTVLVLFGLLSGKYYGIDYRRGKWQSNLDICDQLVELWEDWNIPGIPFTVYPESVAYQNSFKGDFQRYVVNDLQLYEIKCTPSRLKGDKLQHVMSISGIYANDCVRYNKFTFHKNSPMITELTQFGAVPHDDALDATALALHGIGITRRLESI